MNRITSILYTIFINLWGIIIPIAYSWSFVNNSRKLADRGARNWSRFAIYILRKLCKIDYRILGKENLPQTPFIIACKHQSMWETVVFNILFPAPALAYKKELLRVPFYGWFLRNMSGIAVDRDGGMKAMKHLISESKKFLSNNQVIVIFPQGTRVPVGASTKDYPYQPGIAAIYSACKVPVVPVALDSGKFWPKSGVKTPGTITLKYLPPINPGLSKDEFMQKLEEEIEGKITN